MQRRLRIAVLAVLAVAAAVCADGASSLESNPASNPASDPAILRMDAFVATRYDASTALVFFSSAAVPADPGVPAGVWPPGAAKWLGAHARLRLVRDGSEKQWIARWPGGATFAPHRDAEFVLVLGGSASVHGRLSTLGYIPLCDTTWMVGMVSVDADDRELYNSSAAEGFAAYVAPANGVPIAAPAKAAARASLIGPVILSSDADALGAARAKIEAALQARATVDYANYLSERETTYEKAQPTSLVQVKGNGQMIAGRAHLSYTAQKVSVGPKTGRYFVHAVWKSSSGEPVYRISAWFTLEGEMESVTSSEVPLGAAMVDNDRILNIFPLETLPMFDQGDDAAEHGSVLLMEERGPDGALYSLKRWTEGGLLPTGAYFANRCKLSAVQ